MQVGNTAFRQLFDQIERIGFFIRAIIDVLETADGRDANTDTVGAPLFTHRINHFQHQASAIFHAAAVLVSTMVGRRGKELVQQVTVGGVQFDKIESGIAGVTYRLTEIINDPWDLVGFERARH